MKEANGLIEIVKYAAERSGSKYVIGREGWKTMIVSKLMELGKVISNCVHGVKYAVVGKDGVMEWSPRCCA